MKSLLSLYISLLLITISFCDDCSSKAEKDCTGSCQWTETTAASCALATCTLSSDKTACESGGETHCTLSGTGEGETPKCEAKATSCALNQGKTACTPTAGCIYTAATGKCAAASSSSSSSSSSSDESSAFSLKNSFIIYLLSFLF